MIRGKITSHSQSDVLRRRMEDAGFTHGQEARVNLRKVRLRRQTPSEGVVYFCEMKQLEVVEVLQDGDGGTLPKQATVEDLQFAEEGCHDVLGAVLYSNGALQVRADEDTQIVRSSWNPLRRLFSW